MAQLNFQDKTLSVKSILMAIMVFYMIVPANAFVRLLCFNPLGFGRIDPLVSPDKASAHVHHLHGSSGLGLSTVNASQLLEGNCTSCSADVDRSSYWAPAMYFHHDNDTYESLETSSAITIYYKLEKRVNFENQNYAVFPQGFRMIAGNSTKRTWDGPWPVPDQSHWGPADTTQAALAEKALGFNCLNYPLNKDEGFMEYPYLRNKTFIDENCVDGIRAELMFPSCWNGHDNDSPDHKSHVAYPDLIQDGACPASHTVYLPILFYETIWNTQAFKGIPGKFVFANGDPTGYGYHGDFIAAWQDGMLQKMKDDPTCTDHDLQNRKTDGLQEKCLAIASSLQTEDKAAECHVEMPQELIHEEVRGVLAVLPGGVNVTGIQHDPGSSQDHEVPASVSTPAAASTIPVSSGSTSIPVPVSTIASTSASSSMPVSAPVFSSMSNTVGSATMTSAPAVSTSATILSTSTFISDGTYIELVIAEEIVTTTVTAGTEHSLVARHNHSHGHGKHI